MNSEYGSYKDNVLSAVSFLKKKIDRSPEIILILGTGLGDLVHKIQTDHVLPYESIPHFPTSTVDGHSGNLIFGTLGGKYVAALQGRFHFYEGYSALQITFPVRVLSLLGAEILLVSNASGGLNSEYSPGTVMIIKDHLNFIPDNPLRGPNVDEWGQRYPDCSRVYDPEFIRIAQVSAKKTGMENVETGTYVAIPGPSLETPAETRYLRNCGADAVGMSTVPEVLVAVHAGMKVLGLSLVANVNNPDNQQPIRVEDVLKEVEKAIVPFQELIVDIVESISLK
ncbi:MAG: purine-nucleoside phosphorylase [Desulfobulbaceae bacterium]|uniref:Purine nucleoside phosphorylase n=1 Tax=Candidatus Desulfobia pelagia TaxID=2841692 RepID=A0A8J6NEF2_9BACT|nr:purine-nucleoside phosphorylase [Candidatus Desulfobia pelagia]